VNDKKTIRGENTGKEIICEGESPDCTRVSLLQAGLMGKSARTPQKTNVEKRVGEEYVENLVSRPPPWGKRSEPNQIRKGGRVSKRNRRKSTLHYQEKTSQNYRKFGGRLKKKKTYERIFNRGKGFGVGTSARRQWETRIWGRKME